VLSIRLAVNRAAMPAPAHTNTLWQSILQVSGNSGTFVQMPGSAVHSAGTDQLAVFADRRIRDD